MGQQQVAPPIRPPRPRARAQASWQGIVGDCDLLDFVTIISAAVFLLFVVFWLAGVLNGQSTVVADLPDWLKSALKTGKGILTAAGSTAVLQLIRARLKRNTGPQYLVWVLIMFFVLGFSSFGLSKILKQPAPGPAPGPTTVSADLFFNPNYPDGTDVVYVHHYPHKITEYVTRQLKEVVDPPSYLAHISLPADGKTQYSADFRAEETLSRQNAPGSQEGWYSLCVQKSPEAIQGPSRIFLACDEANYTCDIDKKRDKGPAMSCSTDSGETLPVAPQWFDAAPVDAAVDHVLPSDVPFWTVPLLETLEKTNDQKRAGYTRFDIELHPDKSLAGSDTYQYRVVVNGEPIFFNGFPPEVLRDTFAPDSDLRFSFGLENLSFSGADKGYENVTLELTFSKGRAKTAQATISRQYIALRDAPTQQFSTSIGTITWAAKYMAPPHEDKFEVFVNSTPDVSDAMRLKARLDRMKLTIDAKPAVLVVRPPLRIPAYYGVVVGSVQPTGQVQFTFNKDEANGVCSWAMEHSKDTHILRSDLYIYNIATRGYAACSR